MEPLNKMFQDLDHNLSAAQFTTRRLPEIKSLWRSFQRQQQEETHTTSLLPKEDDTSYYQSGGRKISNRHLRRRTTSHFRKKHHRFPQGRVITTVENEDKNNRKRKKSQIITRKAKRKVSHLRTLHSWWQTTTLEDETVTTDTSTCPNQKNWLVTHLWHTKRFHMSPPLLQTYGGFCIPLCHNHRDSQAIVRLVRENDKCTVQDSTWTIGGSSICLEVIEESMEQKTGLEIYHSSSLIHPILQRICGYEDPSFWTDPDFLAGTKMGYSIIYAVDSFPRGAICPGSFLIHPAVHSDEDVKDLKADAGKGRNPVRYKSHVQIFVPPNVIHAVQSMIQELLTSSTPLGMEGQTSYRCYLQKGCASLQLRGKSASLIIQNTLSSSLDAPIVSGTGAEAHGHLRHGTVIRANVRMLQVASPHSQSLEEIVEKNVIGASLGNLQILQEEETSTLNKRKTDVIDDIILIFQNPNESYVSSNRSSNIGCCGWDILCSPTVASDLFQRFNTIEGACAIGMVEHAALHMEADPPLPLWPRDYPDTNSGKEYWSGRNKEWNLIRYSLDFGIKGGRIHTGLRRHIHDIQEIETVKSSSLGIPSPSSKKQKPIDSNGAATASIRWNDLLCEACSGDVNDDDVVLMRGSFVEPLQNIIGLFYYPSNLFDDTKRLTSRRRLRRPVNPSNRPLDTPPLPKDQYLSLRKSTSTLLENMTLPALVRCHIIVENKGILFSNATIYEYDPELNMNEKNIERPKLGFVVSGMFSQSRGNEHGIGFISSRTLLGYLAKGKHGTCAFLRSSNHGIQYFVRAIVTANDDAVGRSVFISLLF
jgi:hypothetical protein